MAPKQRRVEGIDVARALATLAMIQTHAYDAWVTRAARDSLSFKATRLIGTLPLPMFLMLAGMAVTLRVRAGLARAEETESMRRELVRSGLMVLATGYGLNVLFGLTDGARTLDTFLRVDVLHAIGMSLVLVSLLAVRGEGERVLNRLHTVALLLTALPLLLCPWLTAWGHGVQGPARYVVGPWVEVPGISHMPLVPLTSWCALGVLIGRWLDLRRDHTDTFAQISGARKTHLGVLICGSLGGIALGYALTSWMTQHGVTPSRQHPIIWFNAIDLAGRAGLTIALMMLVTPRVPRVSRVLIPFGQQSLFVYGLHLPFCYGRIAQNMKHSLDMSQASRWLLLLYAGCAAAVFARQRGTMWRQKMRVTTSS